MKSRSACPRSFLRGGELAWYMNFVSKHTNFVREIRHSTMERNQEWCLKLDYGMAQCVQHRTRVSVEHMQ